MQQAPYYAPYYRVSHWAIWNKNFGVLAKSQEKLELRRDLAGHHFKTASLPHAPFVRALNATKANLPQGYKVRCQSYVNVLSAKSLFSGLTILRIK